MLRQILGRNTVKSPSKASTSSTPHRQGSASSSAPVSKQKTHDAYSVEGKLIMEQQQNLQQISSRVLADGNLRKLVQLPEGTHVLEWIACHVHDFAAHLSILTGLVQSCCTDESCPIMNAGPSFEYHWSGTDGTSMIKDLKKPIPLSAPKYIATLLQWTRELLADETLFPVQNGIEFGKAFLPTVRTILRRLTRIYGHLYHAHFDWFVLLNQEAHLNSSFKHFYYFCAEFDGLVSEKDFVPLQPIIQQFISHFS